MRDVSKGEEMIDIKGLQEKTCSSLAYKNKIDKLSLSILLSQFPRRELSFVKLTIPFIKLSLVVKVGIVLKIPKKGKTSQQM